MRTKIVIQRARKQRAVFMKKWIPIALLICLFGCSTTDQRIEEIATESVKRNLHDPNSFELISIDPLDINTYLKKLQLDVRNDPTARYNFQRILEAEKKNTDPILTLVHIHFRAKNGFGAIRVFDEKVICGNLSSPSQKFGILLK